jgi:hypothetical protein
MPEGDLRDVYRVVERVSSGRWRPRLRLTEEKDSEKLEEKYGEKWLKNSGKLYSKPPKAPTKIDTTFETVTRESDAGDDVSKREEISARPERASAVQPSAETATEPLEPAVSEHLDELVRETEVMCDAAPETEVAEAAKAVLEDEMSRAEAETETEWLEPTEETRPESKAVEEKPLTPLRKTHDSFSSMPLSSPSGSDGGNCTESKRRVSLESLLQPGGYPDSAESKARDARWPPVPPRTLQKAEKALWKIGCFCGGFLGMMVLSYAHSPKLVSERVVQTRKRAAAARTSAAEFVGVREEVASPRILKEVFSP